MNHVFDLYSCWHNAIKQPRATWNFIFNYWETTHLLTDFVYFSTFIFRVRVIFSLTFPAWLLQPSGRSFPARAKGQAAQPFIPAKWRGRPASIVHLNGCDLDCSIVLTMTLLSDFNSPPTSYYSASNLFLSSLNFFSLASSSWVFPPSTCFPFFIYRLHL